MISGRCMVMVGVCWLLLDWLFKTVGGWSLRGLFYFASMVLMMMMMMVMMMACNKFVLQRP